MDTFFIICNQGRISTLKLNKDFDWYNTAQIFLLTDSDRKILRENLYRDDAMKLAFFLKTLPILKDESKKFLLDIASKAMNAKDERGIKSPNGLAWLIILEYLSIRNENIKKLILDFSKRKFWSFDQLASILSGIMKGKK